MPVSSGVRVNVSVYAVLYKEYAAENRSVECDPGDAGLRICASVRAQVETERAGHVYVAEDFGVDI